MEGSRCSVRSLAALDRPIGSATLVWAGTDLLLSNGSNLVLLHSTEGQTVKAVHTFPSPVVCLVPSPNQQGMYALCEHDGIHFIPLPQLLRSSSVPSSEDSGSGSVATNSQVIADPAVSSFVVADGVLVTVGLADGRWRFSLYEIPEASAAQHRKVADRHIFATPAGGGAIGARSQSVAQRPVLFCVYAMCSLTSQPPEGNDCHMLDPALFSLLFGVDSSLIPLPMFVCGLPDGRLCSLPALQQPGDVGPAVKVLHSLEEPIVFLGISMAGDGSSGGLVVVGGFGKVLLVLAEQKEGCKVLAFREWGVAGPVVTACLSGTRLYYSTRSDLLVLSLGNTEQKPTTGLEPASSSQNPVSLNVCSVTALAKPTTASTGAVQLMATSDRGRLLQITPLGGSGGGGPSRLSPSQVGQKMKDLLAGIGNVAERASLLKSSIQVRNTALKKLNQVFNICCLLLPSQNGREGHLDCKPPISFHLTTKWVSLLREESLTLSCVLENSSSYVLECGWTLCIQVVPSYSSLTSEDMATKTYSFPLEELAPGKTLKVTLPLAAGNELRFPVKVCSSLIYSLQSMLGCSELECLLLRGTPWSRLVSDSGLVSLALDAVTLDWLHCLHIDGPVANADGFCSGVSSSADPIQTFLRARRWEQWSCGRSGPSPGSWGVGPFTATLRVSSALLRAMLAGSTLGGPSLCASLLAWLVSSCPGNRSRADLSSPVVCARCPQGDRLKLMAKEVTVEEVSSDGPLLAVEVQLESSSLVSLCGLHHAVLHRLQALLGGVTKATGDLAQLQGRSLRGALERAEALLREIWEARDLVSLGAGVTRRAADMLLHVYTQLRTQPLLIL
uniref:FA core complex associated protein 100 n=1 Tax=Paramormyrops kingsleyae TaxID=1676925 RepID=A0A3B3SUN7_9TELE|nr:Fanconi anemia core complex-associated protein 100 [Paramormyrops kingsleyae]